MRPPSHQVARDASARRGVTLGGSRDEASAPRATPSESSSMRITSNFDSGNIECLDCSNPTDIRLAINKDRNSDFYQWFHFRLVGARGLDCALRIMNAGGAAYPKGWENYRACASYDRRDWFRVATAYDGTVLTINHRPEHD